MSALLESPFFGVTITIVAYWIGVKIQQRTKLAICNYMLIAVALLVAVLVVFDIPYESYYVGGNLINLFLGPATACMAVSVYAKLELLKKNWLPVLVGCTVGVATSLISIFVMCRLFGLDREMTASLLPKSVTTPIGHGDFPGSRRPGGHYRGGGDRHRNFGNLIAPMLVRLFRIKDPPGSGAGHRCLQPCCGNGQGHGDGRDGRRYERSGHRPLRYFNHGGSPGL